MGQLRTPRAELGQYPRLVGRRNARQSRNAGSGSWPVDRTKESKWKWKKTVFGKAVDEFYKKLSATTDSLVAACRDPSPTLTAVAANMVCEAAEACGAARGRENSLAIRRAIARSVDERAGVF